MICFIGELGHAFVVKDRDLIIGTEVQCQGPPYNQGFRMFHVDPVATTQLDSERLERFPLNERSQSLSK